MNLEKFEALLREKWIEGLSELELDLTAYAYGTGTGTKETLDDIHAKQSNVAHENLGPWFRLLQEFIFWNQCFTLWLDVNKDKVKGGFALMLMSGSICSQTVSIYRLVACGLDSSARIIVRCLIELTQVAVVASNDQDFQQNYLQAKSHNDFWYEWMSKGKLQKRFDGILGKRVATTEVIGAIKDMSRWRKDANKICSEFVHGSFLSTLLASFPTIVDGSDICRYGISGEFTPTSEHTCELAVIALWEYMMYTMMFLCEPLGSVQGEHQRLFKLGDDIGISVVVRYFVLNKMVQILIAQEEAEGGVDETN